MALDLAARLKELEEEEAALRAGIPQPPPPPPGLLDHAGLGLTTGVSSIMTGLGALTGSEWLEKAGKKGTEAVNQFLPGGPKGILGNLAFYGAQAAPMVAAALIPGGAEAEAAAATGVAARGAGALAQLAPKARAAAAAAALDYPMRVGANVEVQDATPGHIRDNGAAALYAIPQTVLDVILPAIVGAKLAGFATPKAIKGLLTTVARDAATGVAIEVPSQLGAQVLTRMQAGKPLADDEAIAEYKQVAEITGILGGLFGAMGGVSQHAKDVAAERAVKVKEGKAYLEAKLAEAIAKEDAPPPPPPAEPPFVPPGDLPPFVRYEPPDGGVSAAESARTIEAARRHRNKVAEAQVQSWPADMLGEVAQEVNFSRSSRGLPPLDRFTIADLNEMEPNQLSRALQKIKPNHTPEELITEPKSEAKPKADLGVDESQYELAVAAVRKNGKYSAPEIKKATGIKDLPSIAKIRDTMVARGDLTTKGRDEYGIPPERPKPPAQEPAPAPKSFEDLTATGTDFRVQEVALKAGDGSLWAVRTPGKNGSPDRIAKDPNGNDHYFPSADAARAVASRVGGEPVRVEAGPDLNAAAQPRAWLVTQHALNSAGKSVATRDLSVHGSPESAADAAGSYKESYHKDDVVKTGEDAQQTLDEIAYSWNNWRSSTFTRGPQVRADEAILDTITRLRKLSPADAAKVAPHIMPKAEFATSHPEQWNRTKALLEQMAKDMNFAKLGIKLDLVDKLIGPDGQPTAQGVYLNNTIELAMAPQLKDGMSPVEVAQRVGSVLHHEVIHAFRSLGLFTDAEWGKLRQHILTNKPAKTKHTYLEHAFVRYGTQFDPLRLKRNPEAMARAIKELGDEGLEVNPDTLAHKLIEMSKDMIEEEAVAEAFRDWARGRMQAPVKGLFARLVQFVRTLWKGMSNSGAEPVFLDISKGVVASRNPTIDAMDSARFSLGPDDYTLHLSDIEPIKRGRKKEATRIRLTVTTPDGDISSLMQVVMHDRQDARWGRLAHIDLIGSTGGVQSMGLSAMRRLMTTFSHRFAVVDATGMRVLGAKANAEAALRIINLDVALHRAVVDGNPVEIDKAREAYMAEQAKRYVKLKHMMVPEPELRIRWKNKAAEAEAWNVELPIERDHFDEAIDTLFDAAVVKEETGAYRPIDEFNLKQVRNWLKDEFTGNTDPPLKPAGISERMSWQDIQAENAVLNEQHGPRRPLTADELNQPVPDDFEVPIDWETLNSTDRRYALAEEVPMGKADFGDPEGVGKRFAYGGTPEHIQNMEDSILYTQVLRSLQKGARAVNKPLRALTGLSDDDVNRLSEAFIRKAQDAHIGLGKLVDHIRTKGGNVSWENDPMLQTALAHDQMMPELREAHDTIVEPMIRKVSDLDLSWADFSDYLVARHAPERNALVRTRREANEPTDEFFDGGSGITDEQAAQIMTEFQERGLTTRMEEAAGFFDAMVAELNKVREEAGLITSADIIALGKRNTGFQYWISLKGLESLDGAHIDDPAQQVVSQVAKHFKIGGLEDQHIKGRRTEAKNPIENSILIYYQAIMRAKRNQVGQALGRLMSDPINEQLAMHMIEPVTHVPTREVLSHNNRIVKVPDLQFRQDPNIFTYKDKGEIKAFRIYDDGLRRALNGPGPQTGGAALRGLQMLNQTLVRLSTGWNPEFIFTNLVKDFGEAMFNLGQYNLPGLRRSAASNMKDAFSTAYNSKPQNFYGNDAFLHADPRTWSMDQAYYALQKKGGLSQWFDRDTIESVMLKVKDTLGNEDQAKSLLSKGLHGFKQVVGVVEHWNTAAEHATRLAAFKAMIDQGVPVERAAYAAKNLTVNFSRGGENRVLMNALYLFYNASIQGSATILHALASSKKLQKVALGIMAMGAMQDYTNSLLSDKAPDGSLEWDSVPQWKLESAINLPIPGTGQYFSLPLPWGLSAAFNIGRSLARATRDGKIGKASSSILTGIISSFSPIGGIEKLGNFFMPTIGDPILDIYANTDWANRPIVPQQAPFGGQRPQSQLYWNSTSATLKDFSHALNYVTGGDEATSGLVDVSPNLLEYWTNFALGGAGMFALRGGDFAVDVLPRMLRGEDWDWNQVPFFRRMFISTSSRGEQEKYSQHTQAVLNADLALRDAVKAGDMQRVQRYQETYGRELMIAPSIKRIVAMRASLATQLKNIERSNIPDEAKVKARRDIKSQMDQLVNQANILYREHVE